MTVTEGAATDQEVATPAAGAADEANQAAESEKTASEKEQLSLIHI